MALADVTITRATKVGHLMVNESKTIREIAKLMGVSKTTIHRDVTERLPRIDSVLSNKVQVILNAHAQTRHILGGEAVKKRFTVDQK